jgi:hypothetical protein
LIDHLHPTRLVEYQHTFDHAVEHSLLLSLDLCGSLLVLVLESREHPLLLLHLTALRQKPPAPPEMEGESGDGSEDRESRPHAFFHPTRLGCDWFNRVR